MAAGGATDRPVATPRLAATMLLIREAPLEVMMVRRHPEQYFASALVFPGGLVDESDRSEDWLPLLVGAEGMDAEERAIRICVLRETFEETSILLARDAAGRPVTCADPDPADPADFRATVAASGGQLWLDDLVRFAHWITPEGVSRRFDTHFFLAAAPDDQVAQCDGGEAVAIEWVEPAIVSEPEAARARSIIFPTRMNLTLLARSASVERAIADTRARPVATVRPRLEKRGDGFALVLPEDAGYGPAEEWVKALP